MVRSANYDNVAKTQAPFLLKFEKAFNGVSPSSWWQSVCRAEQSIHRGGPGELKTRKRIVPISSCAWSVVSLEIMLGS